MAAYDFAIRGLVDVNTSAAEAKLLGFNTRLQSISSAVGGNFTKMQALGGVALGALSLASVDFVKNSVQGFRQVADETLAVQRTMGGTTEQASSLRGAAKELGIDTDLLNRGLVLLAKHLVDGGKNFTKYGISIYDANHQQKDAYQILSDVADKYVQLGRGVQGAALSQDAFGRGGRLLIPLLTQGSSGLQHMYDKAKQLGIVLGEDDVKAAFELGVQQRDLQQAVLGLEVSVGRAAIPTLKLLASFLTHVVEVANEIPAPVKDVALAFVIVGGAAVGLGLAIRVVQAGLAGLTGLSGTAAAATGALGKEAGFTQIAFFGEAAGAEEAATAIEGYQMALVGTEFAIPILLAVAGAWDAIAHASQGAIRNGQIVAGHHIFSGIVADLDTSKVRELNQELQGLNKALDSGTETSARFEKQIAGVGPIILRGGKDVDAFGRILTKSLAQAFEQGKISREEVVKIVAEYNKLSGGADISAQAILRQATALKQQGGNARLAAQGNAQLMDQYRLDTQNAEKANLGLEQSQLGVDEATLTYRNDLQSLHQEELTRKQDLLSLQQADLAVASSQLQLNDTIAAEKDLALQHQSNLLSIKESEQALAEARQRYRQDLAGGGGVAGGTQGALNQVSAELAVNQALARVQLDQYHGLLSTIQGQKDLLSLKQAELQLTEAQRAIDQNLAAREKAYSIESAQLGVQQAQHQVDLDRRRGLIGTLQGQGDLLALERARLDLAEAKNASDKAAQNTQKSDYLALQRAQLALTQAKRTALEDSSRAAHLALQEKQDTLGIQQAQLGVQQAQQQINGEALRHQQLILQTKRDYLAIDAAQWNLVDAQTAYNQALHYELRDLQLIGQMFGIPVGAWPTPPPLPRVGRAQHGGRIPVGASSLVGEADMELVTVGPSGADVRPIARRPALAATGPRAVTPGARSGPVIGTLNVTQTDPDTAGIFREADWWDRQRGWNNH